MIKKQGITVTMMVVTIIILTILATTITITTYSTINYSKLSTWANEMQYVQEIVDEQLSKSSQSDFTLGEVILYIESNSLKEQFEGETITSDNILNLKILDLGKLKITNTSYGNLKTDKDVYAISQETGKVYYVAGIEVDGQTYYSLTDSLRKRFDMNTVAGKLSSVVFVPNVVGYTNKPITLTVKLPNTYTNIVISTTNNEINIGEQQVKENIYEYTVNSNLVGGNYTVNVSYNDGVQTHTSNYQVTGYDVTPPEIQGLTKKNFVYKESDLTVLDYIIDISATDESGIKVIKYALGTITEQQAKDYFEKNLNIITNGRINLDRETTVYTIYAEDKAGNFSILTFNKNDFVASESNEQNTGDLEAPVDEDYTSGESTANDAGAIESPPSEDI